MAKVSIIIPVYEVEEVIEECLKSVVRQTFYDIEVLCIIDATLDNSVSIIKDYQQRDPRIRIVHHASNRGLSASRNTGLRLATGDYIKFVDSDDVIALNAIEILVQTIERVNADWAFSAFNIIDVNGKILESRSPFHTTEIEQIAAAGVIDFRNSPELLNQMWPSAWHSLLRSSKIRESGAFFPEGLYFEDHEFFFTHGLHAETAIYVPEHLYFYRSGRAGQITAEVSRKIFDIFEVLERMRGVLLRNLPPEMFRAFYARLCIRLLVERTWILPTNSPLFHTYRDQASRFLARFEDEEILKNKDWYIKQEDLDRIWVSKERVDVEPSAV